MTNIPGNMTIARNLKVEGWLDAKNIKGPCKGLYAAESALLEAHPYPRPGWWALVGEALPARLYQVDDLEWYDTGNDWDFSSLSLDSYDQQIETLEAAIERINSLFEPYIVNDGETTIVTTTETVTREVEVADDESTIIDPGTTNLIDLDDLLYGYDISSGQLHATSVGIMSNKIAFQPGETYTIENCGFYADKVFVAFYDSSDNYIGRVGFTPTTTVAQGTNSSGTQHWGVATLTVIEAPETVENQKYAYGRVVLQAQTGSDTSAYTVVDLDEIRIYLGIEWVDATYSDGSGTHTETVTETVATTKEVTGERLDLSGVCKCSGSESTSDSDDSESTTTIRILSIGNSYSRDSLAYLPYIMPDLAGVHTEIGILYQGSCTIDTHYSNAVNDTAAYTLDYNAGDGSAWAQTSRYTIARALALQEWDIILLQQASTSAYDSTTYSNLDALIDILAAAVTYPVRFGWLLTQARPRTLSHEEIAANFLAAASIAEGLLETSPIDFVMPVGTAIQNARATSLYTLGDGGELVASDGIHLQEGLPCMIAAYAAALTLCGMCGKGYRSVVGEQTRATSTWLSDKNIPEQNGSAIEGTEAQYLIGQKCAVMAKRHPYVISYSEE